VFRRLPPLILAFLLLAVTPQTAFARYAAIVVDADTGRILHSENADTQNYPASLTKMMTLFMTFEALKSGQLTMNQELPVSSVAERRSPSKLGLRRGQKIKVGDAIAALVTKSANDVATVLAEAIGGTERKFADQMTDRAKALGMNDTVFKNASGLPNRSQLSTAKDMAILARALIRQFPEHYDKFAMESFTWQGTVHRTHNRLMLRYEGMDGIKTGYTAASGFNLVASAKRNGKRLIAVVFGGKTSRARDNQVAKLLDDGFAGMPVLTAKSGSDLGKLPVSASREKFKASGKPKAEKAMAGTPIVNENSGSVQAWAIQVGAYNRYAPAHLAVTRAARAVPSLLGSEFKIVRQSSTAKRGLNIYKARLLVASESKARTSCDALKRRNIDCMVIFVGGPPS
jgi:D-alanyl-D-alanine carboxypeptidase